MVSPPLADARRGVNQLAQELLEHAERLLEPDASGSHRQVDLRRAISAAYYAVFHELCAEFASSFPAAVQPWAHRALGHREAANKAAQAASGKLPGAVSCPNLVRAIARNFVDLQGRRETADYDPAEVVSERDARHNVQRARTTLAEIESARQSCADELTAFVLSLAVKSRA